MNKTDVIKYLKEHPEDRMEIARLFGWHLFYEYIGSHNPSNLKNFKYTDEELKNKLWELINYCSNRLEVYNALENSDEEMYNNIKEELTEYLREYHIDIRFLYRSIRKSNKLNCVKEITKK